MVVFCLTFATAAFAAEPVGYDAQRQMHRQEMKQIKKAQHEAKQTAPAGQAAQKKNGFWEKESERSGLGSSGNSMGTFLNSLNPMPFLKDQNAKYKARKAGMAQAPVSAVK